MEDLLHIMEHTYTYSYICADDGLLHEGKGNSAPNTNKNLGNSDTALGESDYWKMSGWVFTVNNNAAYSGKKFDREDGKESTNPTVRNIYQSGDKVTVKNGDVIRVMFTLFGYGADVGIDTYQATVNSAATALKNAIKSPQNPAVGAVKIKTAKNVKGKKIKLTLTKTAGVTGFQIKYGNNKI